ncbi:MAG: alpha/beta fold hydrolase [Bacteroidota bacterium]
MNVLLNGANINYVEFGNRDRMPVTFLHGFPFSHEMWTGQLEVVGERHRAIAYDIRGHGQSDVLDGQYTIEGHVDDLIALLDHLGVDRTVIVGLSMGGYITLRALQRNSERFAAAVLCDTRSEADSDEGKLKRFEAIRAVKEHGSGHFAESFVRAVFAPETFERSPETVGSIQKTIARTPPLSIAGTLLALASRMDTSQSLGEISVPTLVMVGEHDVVTPPSDSRMIHERIKSSQLVVIPQAAHMSNLENPRYFNDHLLSFLNDL